MDLLKNETDRERTQTRIPDQFMESELAKNIIQKQIHISTGINPSSSDPFSV